MVVVVATAMVLMPVEVVRQQQARELAHLPQFLDNAWHQHHQVCLVMPTVLVALIMAIVLAIRY
jgi:hypothetical protein